MNTENKPAQTGGASAPPSLKGMLERDGIKKRFEEILGKKAPGFISSIINLVNTNSRLGEADPNTVIMSAAVAATLDLPINPNLGFAYIVPYKNRGVMQAQFQMGYKGFIQLAMRTGQYLRITAREVYAGQLIKANPFTEEYLFDEDPSKEKGEIIGFMAYFKMLNGFEKTVYWNVAKLNEHAKRYSKSYNEQFSPWKTNYPEMGMKTVLKHCLSKYGILSIEMQKALNVDQGIVKDYSGDIVDHADVVDVTHQEQLPEQTNEGTIEPVAQTEAATSAAPATNGTGSRRATKMPTADEL